MHACEDVAGMCGGTAHSSALFAAPELLNHSSGLPDAHLGKHVRIAAESTVGPHDAGPIPGGGAHSNNPAERQAIPAWNIMSRADALSLRDRLTRLARFGISARPSSPNSTPNSHLSILPRVSLASSRVSARDGIRWEARVWSGMRAEACMTSIADTDQKYRLSWRAW
jgi:hypothetical protein